VIREGRNLTHETAIPWHGEVITEGMQSTLRSLQERSILAPFYLAGGTGLALRLGHRRSRDLDFFRAGPLDERALLGQVQGLGGFSLTAIAPRTLHAVIEDTKVSFLEYSYPLLFPGDRFLGVVVADSRDIACMKLSAIASRGTKRDFVDVWAAAQPAGLPHLLELFQQKFAQAAYNLVHVLKSLTYFEDADREPKPDMLRPLSWDEVKQFFLREAPRLL